MVLDPYKIIQVAEIPPIPQLIQQIMSLADQPSTTIQKMESLVVQEPALVTKILKWVNSALYSFPQRINSVRHAMIILGFATVRSIASGLILMNAFEDIPGIDKAYVTNIWEHGLKSAHNAKVLAAKENLATQDILYLSCMIQNVGHLVLKQYFGSKYSRLTAENICPSCEEEQAAFDIDHAIVGGALLKEWRFSEEVIHIVTHHHHSTEDPISNKLLAYVKLSNQLTTLNSIDETTINTLDEEDLKTAQIDKIFVTSQISLLKKIPQMVELLIHQS